MNKSKILLNFIDEDIRWVITKDKYNWIVKRGSTTESNQSFAKHCSNYYFTSLAEMFRYLHQSEFRRHLKSFNSYHIIEAFNQTSEFLENIGNELDEKFDRVKEGNAS